MLSDDNNIISLIRGDSASIAIKINNAEQLDITTAQAELHIKPHSGEASLILNTKNSDLVFKRADQLTQVIASFLPKTTENETWSEADFALKIIQGENNIQTVLTGVVKLRH